MLKLASEADHCDLVYIIIKLCYQGANSDCAVIRIAVLTLN